MMANKHKNQEGAMIYIKSQNHMTSLLEVLSATGEFPYSSLLLLGNARVMRLLVQKASVDHKIRIHDRTIREPMQLITISGKGARKTIRLTRLGVQVLCEMNPAAGRYYMDCFASKTFSGDEAHVGRNHRVAEALAVFKEAGFIWFPSSSIVHEANVQTPIFYSVRQMKVNDDGTDKKTAWTRIIGGLVYGSGYYGIYNTRNSVMRWSGAGELKGALMLEEYIRSLHPGKYGRCDSAILFGKNAKTAIATMQVKDGSVLRRQRLDDIYPNVHFVPLSEDGIRLLRILTTPGWQEHLRDSVFPRDIQLGKSASFECDARHGDTWILSHLDGNLARLLRFREVITEMSLSAEVVAFPWQSSYLQSTLGEAAGIREIDMDRIEKNMQALRRMKGES